MRIGHDGAMRGPVLIVLGIISWERDDQKVSTAFLSKRSHSLASTSGWLG